MLITDKTCGMVMHEEGKAVKRMAFILFMGTLLSGVTACGSARASAPDEDAAVGVIVVSNQQELPENSKVYAGFADHNYTFDLDAACVYYFNANAEEIYAGDQNFISLTFGADLDNDTVGAEGAVAFQVNGDAENSVTAYYLYHDESGVYFDTAAYFDTMELPTDDNRAGSGQSGEETAVLKGKEYPCEVTFVCQSPAVSFSVTAYDENHNVVSEEGYTPDEVTDYQQFAMDSGIISVEVASRDADGNVLGTETVTPEDSSAVICFDNGGQILGSKMLRFVWED